MSDTGQANAAAAEISRLTRELDEWKERHFLCKAGFKEVCRERDILHSALKRIASGYMEFGEPTQIARDALSVS